MPDEVCYDIVFEKNAKKEFLSLETQAQRTVKKGIECLGRGNFNNDIVLKCYKYNYSGVFRKRVGNYRIVYLKENNILLITLIRVADRKEVY